MKSNKHKISDSVAEAVVELILTIVLFGVGFVLCLGIKTIFSVKMDDLDFDTFVLIGIIFLIVIMVVILLIKRFFKYLRNKDK